MRIDEFHNPRVDLPPMFVRTNRTEFELRHFNRQVEIPGVSNIYDVAGRVRNADVRKRTLPSTDLTGACSCQVSIP